MTYQVSLAGSGLIGWQYLKYNQDSQMEILENSASVSTDLDYFKENIGNVETVEDFVSDYRLMSVALSAFGMSDQIEYTALLQQVLEEGAEDSDSLANRLSSTDSRFLAFAEAFSFTSVSNVNTKQDGFADQILDLYDAKSEETIESLREDYAARLEEYAATGVTEDEVASRKEFYDNEIEAEISSIENKSEYFRTNISGVSTASELVFDATLFEVTQVAFGVEYEYSGSSEHHYRKLQRVLEGGAEDPNSLANVLGDASLIKMAKAFGFDKEPSLNIHSDEFAESIANDYLTYAFEESVGNQYEELRFALNFKRAIPEMTESDVSSNSKWYQVLSNESLREVFQTALGLPSEFAYIDIDKQLETIQEKTNSRFGISEFDDLADEEILEEVINTYLLVNEATNGGTSSSGQYLVTLLAGG